MVPNRLARALSRLHDSIVRSHVMEALGPLRLFSNQPRPDLHVLLECYAALNAAQAQFGDQERILVRALGLDGLMEAGWWSRLITATTRATMPDELASSLVEICARLEVVTGGFPAFAALLESAATVSSAQADGLAITLAGQGGEPPSLARVALAITAMTQLWVVAEEVTGQPGPLRLVAMDSGPATTLYFDGPAEPLLELRGLLLSVWEQAARLGDGPTERLAALVPDMLPLVERIGRTAGPGAARARGAAESGVAALLQARCSLRGAPAPATSTPPRPAPRHVPPAPVPETGVSHLAQVIAEERDQLQKPEPARRLWQGSAASHSA